ncbi:unnamed protein product [Clonostachys rosea]|uniref:Xylanolytic transcriptional activator regulatory domain-containing protein n=1 Tax=Bionectria ochroleuca TaxID=29856 RepID=A0ABY6UMG7_BIOOC|nr:unnamed protein product [Clonostachys rosea]
MSVSKDDKSGEDENQDVGILKMQASMIKQWETLAYSKLELERGSEAANTIKYLLETYFRWQNASNCVVYRPVFIRDLALGEQFFNEFLLQVICAVAIRCSTDYNVSSGGESTSMSSTEAEYLARAKALLSTEMDKPSSIPTIQGLLLLGQRECAHGNLSQGWMYTGMAFRAMRDMGIHLDCSRLPIFGFGTLTVEDREIRRRLFWAAFTWDKIISLALGRTPTFNAHQTISPGPLLDDTEDFQLWQPEPHLFPQYQPRKSYATANFESFVKLCEIIQAVIMQLYVGRPRLVGIGKFIQAMRTRLNRWFDCLPAEIKIDTANLPEQCPPPHIFATNALYRASWILLYRIFIPNILPAPSGAPGDLMREASTTCTARADEIYHLSKLYAKSFGLRNMTYVMTWSIYSAATINAIDFRSDNLEIAASAGPRLSMSMRSVDGIQARLTSDCAF